MQFYWLYLLLGPLMGLFGAFYNKVLFGLQKAYRLGPWPEWLQPLFPFALAGVLALCLPQVLGGGHDLITGMAAESFTLRMLVILLVGKFAFSMLSFCSGAPGGIFASLSRAVLSRSANVFFWRFSHQSIAPDSVSALRRLKLHGQA